MNLRQVFQKIPGLHISIIFPGRKRSHKKTKEKSLQTKRPPALVLDTSVIIDGRIADIIKTGFLYGTLVLPTCVLSELRRVADSKSELKRNRGRRGLEILEEMKKDRNFPFQVLEWEARDTTKIDEALLNLAKKLKGKILTTDYNLNKAGKVSGVPILNVNELANMVKTILLPGETLRIKLIQPGKEPGQGVGYLPDGIMVVVENGEGYIGQEIETVVERLFQTEAGRMIFVRPLKPKEQERF